MKIGKLAIPYLTVLSPMASLTDIVFRQLLDEIGYIGYLVTEMVSAEGIRRRNQRTLGMIKTPQLRTPQFVQLFGNRPESFSEAVRYIRDETEFSGIDINLGCPVRKITSRGAGAALLKNLFLVIAILRAARQNFSQPLTVKIRLPDDPADIPELIRIIEGEGVDAVTVHFRRVSDRYSDPARWEQALTFRQNVRSVFIGNGDIRTAQEAVAKMKIVDAVMIGREALRNPLIFARIHQELTHDSDNKGILPYNFKNIMMRLLELIQFHYEPEFQLRRLKAYTRFMASGQSYSKRLREKIYQSVSFEEAGEFLERFWSRVPGENSYE